MICFDPFKNLNIIPMGDKISISPCCYSPGTLVDTIDFQNSTYLNDIRLTWLSGEFPSACSNCKQDELTGDSRRIGSNKRYIANGDDNTDIDLIGIDYWIGDLCNLRCAICGPGNSSAWKEELSKTIPIQKMKINKAWINLDLNKIKFIHFNGGEPLLNKEHVTF